MAEVNWLARLQNPHLCKLIGYSAEDVSGPGNRRLLVYEFMNNGSLDMFIKGCGEGSSQALDWSARMRIAFDVAQGLAYLHDKAPFQVFGPPLTLISTSQLPPLSSCLVLVNGTDSCEAMKLSYAPCDFVDRSSAET